MSFASLKTLPIVALSIVTLFISACSSSDSTFDAPNPITVDSAWTPDSVHIQCADESKCPDNQGVLLAASLRKVGPKYRLKVYRCTGTLYSPTKVITAGHSDQTGLTIILLARKEKNLMLPTAWSQGYAWIKKRQCLILVHTLVHSE
jgi:hypothetical protein